VSRFIQIATTTAKRADARRIAGALVRDRLAACVQILGPMESTYRWQGKVETAREWLCLIKTTQARHRKVLAAIEASHPYDTPELVTMQIVGGSRRYLQWLESSVGTAPTRSEGRGAKGERRRARGEGCACH